MAFFVYLLRCADNSLYCGQTNNLEKRIKEHNSHSQKGAKYLRAKKPVKLVYFEEHQSLQSALKRERLIKSWPKAKKENLIRVL